MMDKNPPLDTNVVPLSLVRFERLLQNEIDEKMEGATVNVRMDDQQVGLLPDDSEFLNNVVSKVIDALEEHSSPETPQCKNIIAPLRCMSCGQITRDHSSDCETYINSDSNDEQTLTVGDPFKIDEDVSSEFYLQANTPSDITRVIEGWWCQKCATVNWAELSVENEKIRALWSVELNQAILDRAHYVSSEVVEFAASLVDKPAWCLTHEEVLTILKEQQ